MPKDLNEIRTLEMLILRWKNRNIRCIEIAIVVGVMEADSRKNRNIRCIEILAQ